MKLNKITYFILGTYLGTSPIYWFPGLPVGLVSFLKVVFFIGSLSLIFLTISFSREQIKIPKGFLGGFGFIVLAVLSLPSLLENMTYGFLYHLLDLTYCFVFMFAMYAYANYSIASCFKAFRIAGILFLIAISFYLFFYLIGQNFSNPFNYQLTMQESGFGGLRTGWSNGTALLLPAVFMAVFSQNNNKFSSYGAFGISFMLIYSQILVSGRAGILSSLLAMFLLGKCISRKVFLRALILVLPIAVYFFSDWFAEQLRIGSLFTSTIDFNTLDNFSTGRLTYYQSAVAEILKSPFTGWGFGEEGGFISRQNTTGHMLWLRLAGQGGVFLSITFLVFTISLILKCGIFANSKLSNPKKSDLYGNDKYLLFKYICGIIIVSGFIISFFEPNAPIGTFQNSAMWWAAAGVVITYKKDMAINYG